MTDVNKEADLATALRAMGLIGAHQRFAITPLSGGVSCDVWRVDLADGRAIVVKRALAKLRVAADWRAPAERSEAEVAWLELARTIDPRFAPPVLGEYRPGHTFAMEYLPDERYPLWKARLASGTVDIDFAGRVGRSLAHIHAATANNANIAARFANRAQFFALRLEPYLLHTAGKHPDVAPRILELAQLVGTAQIALMHGDVSPKNILCGPASPVFLDAETACFGDPAFDLAFCLNHLLLKCVWRPGHADAYLNSYGALALSYLGCAAWEDTKAIEARAAALLPVLLLARIDGKSPVEYITAERDKSFVRSIAKHALVSRLTSFAEIAESWRAKIAMR